MGGLTGIIEVEDDPLPLAHHAEDRTDQGHRGEVVLAAVGVSDHHALAGSRVVGLDHALHRRSSYRVRVTDDTGGREFATIDRIAARLRAVVGPDAPGELWIGDDAAVVAIGSGRVVIAADALVAGTHADLGLTTLADLGWKALAVNASDLAAMGCRPSRAVVTVSGPDPRAVDDLYEGLAAAAVAFGCPIVGGDLTSAGVLVISVTVVGDGEVDPRPVARGGARPGDEIWVSGPLGAASAGLRALRVGNAAPDLARAHARPTPRIEEGVAARELGATAMVDISDGFLADLGHVLRQSGIGAALEDVPVAPGATEADALTGGDDYELVWCCPPGSGVALAFVGRGLRPPVRVGVCVTDPSLFTLAGRAVRAGGWEHWR